MVGALAGGWGVEQGKEKELMNTDDSVVIAGGEGVGGVEAGTGGYRVMEGDLTWGGEYTTECADAVLWNCAPDTCIILLTSVTQ